MPVKGIGRVCCKPPKPELVAAVEANAIAPRPRGLAYSGISSLGPFHKGFRWVVTRHNGDVPRLNGASSGQALLAPRFGAVATQSLKFAYKPLK